MSIFILEGFFWGRNFSAGLRNQAIQSEFEESSYAVLTEAFMFAGGGPSKISFLILHVQLFDGFCPIFQSFF